jgi:hypothetical protein
VVFPPLIASRSSVQVKSSRDTLAVAGPAAADASAGAGVDAGVGEGAHPWTSAIRAMILINRNEDAPLGATSRAPRRLWA